MTNYTVALQSIPGRDIRRQPMTPAQEIAHLERWIAETEIVFSYTPAHKARVARLAELKAAQQ